MAMATNCRLYVKVVWCEKQDYTTGDEIIVFAGQSQGSRIAVAIENRSATATRLRRVCDAILSRRSRNRKRILSLAAHMP